MASINASALGKEMIGAATGVFKKKWPEAKEFAEMEFKKLAQSLVSLSKGVSKGTIAKKAAKAILNIHRNAATTVMLAVEGLGLLMVEAAINAALKVVAGAVNTAAGFKFI